MRQRKKIRWSTEEADRCVMAVVGLLLVVGLLVLAVIDNM